MSLQTWLIYLATGRLLTWYLQTNGLLNPILERHSILTKLRDCDLCMGWWVYLGLSLKMKAAPINLFPSLLENVILASLTSLIAHLLRLGWERKFGVTIIDD